MGLLVSLVTTSEFASALALCAFLLSVWSLYWTRISTKISAETLADSRRNTERAYTVEIEQKRYELLKAIAEEYSLILDQVTSIGALKADYDASHEVVKTLMQSHTSLFTVNLPQLENYKTDLESRHLGAINWTAEKGVPELLNMMSAQDVALVNTRHSAKCCEAVVAEIKSKLVLAQNYQRGAVK